MRDSEIQKGKRAVEQGYARSETDAKCHPSAPLDKNESSIFVSDQRQEDWADYPGFRYLQTR
jgi:hypothetical protein